MTESQSSRNALPAPSVGFGASDYERKKQEIEDKKSESISFADFADAGQFVQKFVRDDLPKLSVKALNKVADGVTPGFIKRIRRTKIHMEHIKKEHAQIDNMYVESSATIDAVLAKRKDDKRRHKLLIDHLLATKHLKDEAKATIDEASNKIAEEEFKEFHGRRAAQLKERQDALNKKLTDEIKRQEQVAVDQRVWRITYFGEKANEYSKEVVERNKINGPAIQDKFNLDRTDGEWDERAQARIRMQVENTANFEPYDGPAQDKALYGADRRVTNPNDNDLYVEEFDTNDIHILDSKPYEQYENRKNESDELGSKLFQHEALYKALQADTNEIKQSISRILDLQELVEKDQRQIHQEISAIEKDQMGPPRRLAMAHEIPAMDLWKQRAKQSMIKLHALKYAQEKAEAQKQSMTQQTLQLAKQIAVTKQQINTNKADLATYNDGQGYLPMIIGKSLNKLPGMELLGNPKELMDAISQKSRWVQLNDSGQQAIKFHKETKQLDQEIWVERLQYGGKSGELESVISRIADIAERLQRSKVDNVRLNLVDALKGFFASGLRMHVVNQKLVGLLPWYAYHDYELSHNIARYVTSNIMGAVTFEADEAQKQLQNEANNPNAGADFLKASDDGNSNGITLLQNAYDGHCAGTILLPKDALWSISVTITKQGFTEEYANPFSRDHIIVQLGPSVSSLSTIGVYHNRVNPDTGSVLYDIKHLFRGNSLAYRFEFHSSAKSQKQHLAVCTGIYEEYAIEDVEVIADPKDFKKTRVLSSYVKMLRIEETQGKMRETRLLEELIDVENSKGKFWDSLIVNQTLQRYQKEYFLRILKAEILLQQQYTKMKRMKEQEQMEEQQKLAMRNQLGHSEVEDDEQGGGFNVFAAAGAGNQQDDSSTKDGAALTAGLSDFMHSLSLVNVNPEQQQKLIKSQKKYILKKRLLEQPKVNMGQDLVQKRLILWDDVENKWRNIIVLQCIITWVENGLKAKVLHQIQELDDAQLNIGPPLTLDLLSRKYFLSSIQKINPDLMAKLLEKKKRNDQMNELHEQLQQSLLIYDHQYDKYVKRIRKQFQKYREDTMNGFQDIIPDKAFKSLESSVGRKAVKKLIPDIILDVRKGILTIDEKEDKKEQYLQFAKERFIANYIESTKQQLIQQLDEEELKMNKDIIPKKFREIQQQKEALTISVNQQVDAIKMMLRKQYQIQKMRLLEQVRFPKAVFNKVVPKSFHCEHLKTKAWGNNYATGVKCLQCGKELSTLHEEESQILGFGSGGNSALYHSINEHRENEANYRPKNNDDLRIIEEERVRLEKERRLIEEEECYFYDYDDIQVIYDFDVRHAKDLKGHGIFRQGLHWTEDELDQFMYKQTIKHKIELENKGIIPIHGDLHDEYDPLSHIPNPLPTYRQNTIKHYANYRNYLYFIGRLSSYQKKIAEFKLVRFDTLYEKNTYTVLLEGLHKESYQLEFSLQQLEFDLDRTSQLLAIYNKMNRLWMQANLILNQAKKAKKKIEMSMCPYPYQIKCQQDEYTLVHEEMRQLLKTKLLVEQKVDFYTKETSIFEKKYDENVERYTANAKKLAILKYLMPGNYVRTKYGECFIIAYRQRDDMVIVRLPFGNPPAKAFIYYQEIIAIEQSKAHAEFLLMEEEDQRCQRVYRWERIQQKKERWAMSVEEDKCRRYYEFVDINANQDTKKKVAIEGIIQESYDITETRKYRDLQSIPVKQLLQKAINDRKRRRKDYIGPETNRPKNLSMYEIYKQKKLIQLQLQQAYILKRAKATEKKVDEKIVDERSAWQLKDVFVSMIDQVIRVMIYEIADESIHEGKAAKVFAERKSSIFLPHPTHMQYGTYVSLADTIQAKKEELKRNIILNYSNYQRLIKKMHHEKQYDVISMAVFPPFLIPKPEEQEEGAPEKLLGIGDGMNNWGLPGLGEPKELHQHASKEGDKKKEFKSQHQIMLEKKAARKMKKMERIRQLKLCGEMFQEELRCREFYRWELKENLRERRIMKVEDEAAKFMREEEEKLRKLAEETRLMMQANKGKAGMDDDGGGGGELNAALNAEIMAKRNIGLSYEKRRQELKELTIERRRRQEELQWMAMEDELSFALRELDKLERQRKAFEEEYGKVSDDEGEEEEAEDALLPAKPKSPTGRRSPTKKGEEAAVGLKLPSWLKKLPHQFNEWNVFKQRDYIQFMTNIHMKEVAIEKKIKRDEKRMQNLEKMSYELWDEKYQIVEYVSQITEYQMMLSQEEFLQSKQFVTQYQDNIAKLSIFSRELGEKELRIQTALSKSQQEYTKYQEELKESDHWLQICLNRNKHRDKLKRKIVSNTLFIDTESINAFHQRFETKLLRERVYISYFATIVTTIVNRAEMIAAERKLMLLQHQLTTNKLYLFNRITNMKKTLKEFQSLEYLRMRRSVLNQKFFPKERKNTLTNCFQGWVRYYYWNQGHKDAYKLKFALIKQQLDINRQFQKQLLPAPKPSASSMLLLEDEEDDLDEDDPTTNMSTTSGSTKKTKRKKRDPKEFISNPHHEETTLMHRISSRVIQCQACFQYYLSQQNQSIACAYHPEQYILTCPESCPNPGLTALCISHRMKRWNCCKLTNYQATGCARRYHTPTNTDNTYNEIMRLINVRDADQLANLDVMMEELRKVNWAEEVSKTKMGQLHRVEDEITDARNVAARYKNLKFV